MTYDNFPIPRPDKDIKGYLKTEDGVVILRVSIPETFEIAQKMLMLLEKRLKIVREGEK